MDGKSIARSIRSEITGEITRMKEAAGQSPGLALLLVGEQRDSQAFIRVKLRACGEVGIATFVEEQPEACTEDELVRVVSRLNGDHSVHGIIVQLPLPQHLNEERIVDAVSPEKDVDGFYPLNMGNLAMKGREHLFVPCAAKSCVELLLRSGVEIFGRKVAVIGRSKIARLPTSLLLQRHHATVSTVHAFSRDPERITREADIVVAVIGIPNTVRRSWLKPEAVVVDKGTNQVQDSSGFRTTGDVCYQEAIEVASTLLWSPAGSGLS